METYEPSVFEKVRIFVVLNLMRFCMFRNRYRRLDSRMKSLFAEHVKGLLYWM